MILMRLVPVMPTAPDEAVWMYLESYDLEVHDGRGMVMLTPNADRALRFPDLESAMRAWKQQSTIRPTRPDGKPNRPLTAYHATFETVP